MNIPRLHILTDTTCQDRWSHAQLAEMAIRGGAGLIQFRQKTGTMRELIAAAAPARAACRRAGVPFLVNDRVDLAIAVDADGVHLGWDDFPIDLARRLLGPHRIIGASAGDENEARLGHDLGADYLGSGPIYATSSKPDAGAAAGPDLIGRVRAASGNLPVIAIGGITAEGLPAVLAAGAHGAAVIAAVCASPDPEGATRVLRGMLDAHTF